MPEKQEVELILVTFTPTELSTIYNLFVLGYLHILHECSPTCIEKYHTMFKAILAIGPQLSHEDMHILMNRIEKLCMAQDGVIDILDRKE